MTVCATHNSLQVHRVVAPPSQRIFARPARIVFETRGSLNFGATITQTRLVDIRPGRRAPLGRVVEMRPLARGEPGRHFRLMSKPVEWPKDDPDIDYD